MGFQSQKKKQNGMVSYGMVEVCEGATDRHDQAPCAANNLLRATLGRQWAMGEHGNG